MNIETMKIENYYKINKNNLEINMFVYCLVVGFLLVSLIVLMSLSKKDLYYQNSLFITSNQTASLNVLPDELYIIRDNNYLVIDNKKYYYNILNVELINDMTFYYQIELLLDSNLLVDSINTCKILIREESLFNYVIRIIKGGI